MTTPNGCLRAITAILKRLAKHGDADGISGYIRSDGFLHAFNGLAPRRRQSVMRSYAKAEALCEAKARHPLATPKRIDAKRAEKISWVDPTMKGKLAAAYATAGDDDEKAARLLGVSPGSARLAKRRHLSPETSNH